MTPIKINGHSYQVPASFDEVTVRQFMAMVNEGENLNFLRLLAIFTGIDPDVLANVDDDAVQNNAPGLFNFLANIPDVSKLPRQKEINIRGKAYPIITEPGKQRLGQKLILQQLVGEATDRTNGMADIIARVVANYYAPIVTGGKWSESEYLQLSVEFEQYPVNVIYPEAAFFLSGYKHE